MPEETCLRISDLSLRFGSRQVLDGVNLEVRKGKISALVGESGSGKSLTAKAVLQLLPDYARCSGEIVYDGHDLLGANLGHIRQIRGKRVGMIFQEPVGSLEPLQKVGKQLVESMRLREPGLSKSVARSRAIQLLVDVGIERPEEKLGRYPHELSGGQCQRVLIADVLASSPDVIIADEPTTALDAAVQSQVLDLLSAVAANRGVGILLITHDLALVQRYADWVYVMRKGRIVESDAAAKLFSTPRHSYTKLLLCGAPFTSPAIEPQQSVLLEAKNLTVEYGKKSIFQKKNLAPKPLEDVSLYVRQGECLGVIGESGSGKTTLGLALLGLLRYSGRVLLEGIDYSRLDAKKMRMLRRDIQIVFQDPQGSLNPRILVGESVAEGLKVFTRLSAAELDRRVCAVLEDVALPAEARFKYPHEFSGGERQRIAIARVLLVEPKLLVLDEPSSSLDRNVQFQIMELLRGIQQKRRLSYVFITHDLRLARGLCHRLLILKSGRVVEYGDTEEVISGAKSEYARGLFQTVVF